MLDKKRHDYLWGERNRQCVEFLSAGKFAQYRDTRYKMFLLLMDEKNFTDAFLMLGEVFYWDLNGAAAPRIDPAIQRYAHRLTRFLPVPVQQLKQPLYCRLNGIHTPFHWFAAKSTAEILYLYAVGKEADAEHEIYKNKEIARKIYLNAQSTLNKSLAAQDKQLAAIFKADGRYKQNGDIDKYIAFLESIWEDWGLLFYSSKWWFVLPDLYLKQKRYDDAIEFCYKIKVREEYAESKAEKYIKIATERKQKEIEKALKTQGTDLQPLK